MTKKIDKLELAILSDVFATVASYMLNSLNCSLKATFRLEYKDDHEYEFSVVLSEVQLLRLRAAFHTSPLF